jgi:phosphatidylserine/phosphatidylglycerophosphate/cardiolipin synthase-like enzyme
MRARRPGHLRRRLTGLLAIAVTVCAAIGSAPALASPARGTTASAAAPTVTKITVSPRRLSSGGGPITVSARVHHATRCTLRAEPAVKGLPAVRPCSGRAVRWRTRLPANAQTAAQPYRLTIVAHGVDHQIVKQRRIITVGPPPPPRIARVTPAVGRLDSIGGTVGLQTTVTGATSCTLTVAPAVYGLPRTRGCRDGATAWTVTLPPNPVGTPATYLFTVTATSANGLQATSQRTVSVAAQIPTCPGQTDTVTPTTSTFFNDPTMDTAADQDSVANAMINLICDVSPPSRGVPSTISLAMYEFELDGVAQALRWAHRYRSATVNVALDGANQRLQTATGQVIDNPAYDDLASGLPAGDIVLCGPNAGKVALPPIGDDVVSRRPRSRRQTGAGSTPTPPTGTACAGNNILHAKLLLVSSVDTAGDSAVFTGSQNLSMRSEDDAFNNAVQIVGNLSVYRTDRTYFRRLLSNGRNADVGDMVATGPVVTPSGAISNEFFPRNSPDAFPTSNAYNAANDLATDSTADLLDTVACASPGDFAGDHSGAEPHTTVQIAMYSFRSRPRILKQLEVLERSGCEVQILYSYMSTADLAGLQKAGIQPLQLNDNDYPYPGGGGATGRVYIHSKYLLISGGIKVPKAGVSGNQDIVLTGSQNFTQSGLHDNDEQITEVQQTATGLTGTTPIYSAYEDNWLKIAAVIAALPPAG